VRRITASNNTRQETMGCGNSRLKKELEILDRKLEIMDQKSTYEYWHCIKDARRFELSSSNGRFDQGLKLRQDNIVELYQSVHDDLMNGEDIETYLRGENVNSVFSVDLETVVTADKEDVSRRHEGNGNDNQQHAKRYLKNILGKSVAFARLQHVVVANVQTSYWTYRSTWRFGIWTQGSPQQVRRNENQQKKNSWSAQSHLRHSDAGNRLHDPHL
jgi:hypothetical protein